MTLFVGGLDYQTSEDDLRKFYEQFGDVTDVTVMRDGQSGKSRGFGFVAYSEEYMVENAQNARPHAIGNRTVDSKRAVPKHTIARTKGGRYPNKLFVGGITEDTDDDVSILIFENRYFFFLSHLVH